MVPAAGRSADRIVFLGHSTVLIVLDGVALLTDPLLRTRVAHLRRQVPPLDLALAASADAVLISHVHHDHLDLGSLRLLGHDTPILVPRGGGEWLRRRGFTVVSELAVGREHQIGALTVVAVNAAHDGRRFPLGPHAESVGYVVRGTRTIYFAGDTGLFAGMSGLVTELDVALLPIAGWGTSLGPGHMDPLDAARATGMLDPRVVVPIHWGTFSPMSLRRPDPDRLAEPARRFAGHVAHFAPATEARIVAPGMATEVS